VVQTRLVKSLTGVFALGALLAGPAPAEASHDEQKVREVADDCDHSGSSTATGYASNKRMVRTKSGRQLAIYDPHGFGLHLRWRDPGKGWMNTTRGAVSDGNMPMTDGPKSGPTSPSSDEHRARAGSSHGCARRVKVATR